MKCRVSVESEEVQQQMVPGVRSWRCEFRVGSLEIDPEGTSWVWLPIAGAEVNSHQISGSGHEGDWVASCRAQQS